MIEPCAEPPLLITNWPINLDKLPVGSLNLSLKSSFTVHFTMFHYTIQQNFRLCRKNY